jgi:hypothetical protein
MKNTPSLGCTTQLGREPPFQAPSRTKRYPGHSRAAARWQGTSSTGVDDPKPHGASTRRSDQTKEFPKTDRFLSTNCHLFHVFYERTSKRHSCTGIPLLSAVSPPSLHGRIVGAPHHRGMDKAKEKRTVDATKRRSGGLHFCVPRTHFPGCTPSVSRAPPPLPSLNCCSTTRLPALTMLYQWACPEPCRLCRYHRQNLITHGSSPTTTSYCERTYRRIPRSACIVANGY